MESMLDLLIYELQEAQFPVPDARPTCGPVAALDGDVPILPITQRNVDAQADVTALPELRYDTRFATVHRRRPRGPAARLARPLMAREIPSR